MKNNVYLDFHVIQTVPPSCVNRDDTGSPKTAIYGGVTRARVSSQAWKRAIRLMFKDEFPNENLGVRTKKIVDLIAQRIRKINSDIVEKDAVGLAQKVLEAAGIKTKDNKGKIETGALFFISESQMTELARLAAFETENFDKKKCSEAVKENPAIDIALFGRMVADDPSLNYDAAAQVAHAISTHAVHNEYDYFTAVDDCAPEDNAGAGHLGTVEYNSSTLYRYATVNITELAKNLGSDTAIAVKGFADAFIRSMPTGKQNTFANRTLPDAVYVTIRKDQPINMAGAFEKPVPTTKEGFVDKSIEKLNDYAKKMYADFFSEPEIEWAIGSKIGKVEETVSLNTLLEGLEKEIRDVVATAEVEA